MGTADLVNAVTGFAFWSHSYDRDPGDMLKLQAEIAGSVTASLQVTLLGDQATQLTLGGTQNPRAFDAYLRGRSHVVAFDPESQKAAVAAYGEAIAIDPNFAVARTERAETLVAMVAYFDPPDLAKRDAILADAKSEAERAIQLAPKLGAAHLALAAVLSSSLDFAGCEKEVLLARMLTPGDSKTMMSYAMVQFELGHSAAGAAVAEAAAALDPLRQSTYLRLAMLLSMARRYDNASVALRRAQMLGHEEAANMFFEQLALYRGDNETARRLCARVPNPPSIECLAIAYHRLGRQLEASAEMAKLQAIAGNSAAYNYGQIYAQWGDQAQAAHWLQIADNLHDTGITPIQVDPLLDPIRDTPQYKDIVRQLNFPP
jgi:tetratricopeptide (TPR) repeat protein